MPARRSGTPRAPSPAARAAPERRGGGRVVWYDVNRWVTHTQGATLLCIHTHHPHPTLLPCSRTASQPNHLSPAATWPSSSLALCCSVAAEAASPARSSRWCGRVVVGDINGRRVGSVHTHTQKTCPHPYALCVYYIHERHHHQSHTHTFTHTTQTHQHGPLRRVEAPGLVHQVDHRQPRQGVVRCGWEFGTMVSGGT